MSPIPGTHAFRIAHNRFYAVNTQSPLLTHMTVDPLTVRPATPVAEALEVFRVNRIRHVPVVDADGGLAGMLSLADVRHLDAEARLRGECTCGNCTHDEACTCGCRDELLVRDLMTADPVALSPDDTLGLAADLFLSREFHAVPVVDDGDLVGILTSHDLIRSAFAEA